MTNARALSCGCPVGPGMAISLEVLKHHYKHTIEGLLFWELALRQGEDQEQKIHLGKARIDYLEALEARFPELKELWEESPK